VQVSGSGVSRPCGRQTISERKLPVENDQLILRNGQFSDVDRITPKHVRRYLGWIVAGTKNDDF
jgi:hypothetical protein